MNPAVWVGALFLLGLVVLVAEVFVPSGGVLGFVSLSAFLASIWIAFSEFGVGVGAATLGLAIALVPVALGFAFRIFPDTPLGRRVLPPPPEPEDVVPDIGRRRRARDLVGASGRAASELLPWGRVEVRGESLEAMSEGGPIDAGTEIDVVGVQGAALVVRPRRDGRVPPAAGDGGPAAREGRPPESPASPSEPAPPAADRLSTTLETFTFESLDGPDA